MAEDVGGGDVLAGFGIVDTSRGRSSGSLYGSGDAGMTAHRGVLQPDEYVDPLVLRKAVEEALGFTYADVSAAYAKGRPTTEQRQLREKIDSRLLALSRSGGNMTLTANALDMGERTMDSALKRAREIEVAPIVKNPAVIHSLVCFKCGERGANPRKRRYSDSFLRAEDGSMVEDRRGTVNLCDEDYASGFETQPGNPAYWEFRAKAGAA